VQLQGHVGGPSLLRIMHDKFCSPLTPLFQSQATPAATSNAPRKLASSKIAPPPRSVFTSAMEDAPSDDETDVTAPVATASSSMNAPKQAAPIQKASTPPPRALPKGSAAPPAQPLSKSLNNLKKLPVRAGQGPVASQSQSSGLKTEAVIAAEDMPPDDEGAAIGSETASSTHESLPNALVESALLNGQASAVAASPALSSHDDPFQAGSPRRVEQMHDSEASVIASKPILQPMDVTQSVSALASTPLSPRNSSAVSRSVVRSGAAAAAAAKAAAEAAAAPSPQVAATTHAPLELAESEIVDVADTVHVDLQRFAVSRRQVEPFLDSDDVPLPPELAQLAFSSELSSKIDAGEFCAFQLSCCFNALYSAVCGHCCCCAANHGGCLFPR
jgi:hypothetical protein